MVLCFGAFLLSSRTHFEIHMEPVTAEKNQNVAVLVRDL